MRKFAAALMLVALGLFTLGCGEQKKPATTPAAPAAGSGETGGATETGGTTGGATSGETGTGSTEAPAAPSANP